MSRHAPLSDATLWAAINLQDETIWGCRWAEQTRFAVLDVDETSEYHNELGLARLRHVLSSVGFTRLQLHQSSESGGWHIYLSFTDWVSAEALHTCLKEWLKKEGFEIRAGQLEIFPSNNGLRLPLQKGFAWLDDQGAIKLRREEISADEAVARFCDALDAGAHDWELVLGGINRRLEQIAGAAAADAGRQLAQEQEADEDGFSAFFSFAGMIPEVYEAGRQYWANGLTGTSQRHHAILAVGHYLWYGDESAGVRSLPGIGRAKQRAEAIEAWLREKHNGYSESVLRGDWEEICADIHRACNWEPSGTRETPRRPYLLQSDRAIDRAIGLTKAWGVTCQPKHFEKGNIGREEAAREKIRAALLQRLESGRRVTVRSLEQLSGCDRKTIRRHVDIWGVFRLSNGGGDLSLRGAASLSGSGGSAVLAACPVVFAAKESFDLVLLDADSGDLTLVQDLAAEVCGAPSEDLEQAASLCSAVAPPIPPQAAAMFRFGAPSAEQPCELAPIVLTPPFLLPGIEPTSEPPASRPSPSGSFGSLDAGAPVRWSSGRTADGAGGLEPSCNELPGVRFADSVVNSLRVQPFRVCCYDPPGFDSACRQSYTGIFGLSHYQKLLTAGACIRVNSPQDAPFRVLIYSDVRGPPKRIRAYHALFSDSITIYGATDQKACRAKNRHRLACLRKVPALTQSDVSR